MNRKLLIGVAVVAGLSLYVSMQSDDELLAPSKAGSRAAPRTSTQTAAMAKAAPIDAVVASALIQGVARWQARGIGQGDPVGRAPLSAWAGVRPPAPPPSPVVAPSNEPPPPPMAPRFPHAWVGRFNDESVSNTLPVDRAVVSGPRSTWVVRDGDVIEGQWRIDRIQGRTMSLTYLPLQQQQTVSMR